MTKKEMHLNKSTSTLHANKGCNTFQSNESINIKGISELVFSNDC